MRLTSFAFCQDRGQPREWQLERMYLGSIALLVGKNASGKTKVLNALTRLAQLLRGEAKPAFLGTAEWDVLFQHEGGTCRYELSAGPGARVQREIYTVNGKKLLNREGSGQDEVFAIAEGKFQRFQAPESELAAVNRRDAIQHPFFQPLHDWAANLIRYNFGTPLGKDHLAMVAKDRTVEFNWKDTDLVVGMFRRGHSLFPDSYKAAVIRDMKEIGYELNDVCIAPPVSVVFGPELPAELLGLAVQERDLSSITDQVDMSQGMFRALSLIAQVNYAVLSERPSCVLIDDIGEGLDFERSCGLIRLLTEKAKSHSLQVVLSTNDRFVMNAIPLESWSVLQRTAGQVKVYNYANSKDLFERFRMTGLNNFDFLATDFLNEGAELAF